jgi:hypothetical protein
MVTLQVRLLPPARGRGKAHQLQDASYSCFQVAATREYVARCAKKRKPVREELIQEVVFFNPIPAFNLRDSLC